MLQGSRRRVRRGTPRLCCDLLQRVRKPGDTFSWVREELLLPTSRIYPTGCGLRYGGSSRGTMCRHVGTDLGDNTPVGWLGATRIAGIKYVWRAGARGNCFTDVFGFFFVGRPCFQTLVWRPTIDVVLGMDEPCVV